MQASPIYFLSNSDWGASENDKYPNVIHECVDDIVQPLTDNSGKNVKKIELHHYTVLKPVKICCFTKGLKSEILNLYE